MMQRQLRTLLDPTKYTLISSHAQFNPDTCVVTIELVLRRLPTAQEMTNLRQLIKESDGHRPAPEITREWEASIGPLNYTARAELLINTKRLNVEERK
jgi:hypothetical protein